MSQAQMNTLLQQQEEIINLRDRVRIQVQLKPGSTIDQIAKALGKRTSDISGRLTELYEDGRVKKGDMVNYDKRSQTRWYPVWTEEEAIQIRIHSGRDKAKRQLRAIVNNDDIHDPDIVVMAEESLKRLESC